MASICHIDTCGWHRNKVIVTENVEKDVTIKEKAQDDSVVNDQRGDNPVAGKVMVILSKGPKDGSMLQKHTPRWMKNW